jgi:quercetin 2,3-dioxygenase
MSTFEIHKAEDRGYANHGWLKSYHSFSFANYYNPERIKFGVLRVLNDDIISGGSGFGMHPHDNMEIITIPLEGALKHEDSLGNKGVIGVNEVQVMSAGSGIIHSEYNASDTEDGKFLQIWLFPHIRDVDSRYDQYQFNSDDFLNRFQLLVSPINGGAPLWIHQDAWVSKLNAKENLPTSYQLKKEGNGLYIFVIEGTVETKDFILNKRDAVGIKGISNQELTVKKGSEILIFDIPV